MRGVIGEGGGLREERQSNEQCRHLIPFFFFFFFFFFLRLRYILLIKFMCLLVEMCELLANLRCVVTKVINKYCQLRNSVSMCQNQRQTQDVKTSDFKDYENPL